MQFRTEIQSKLFPFKIDHNTNLISAGSCFANMIGERLKHYKFNVLTNPFGNIFNPISLFKIFSQSNDLLGNLITDNDHYFSYDLHSQFFAHSKLELEEKISSQQSIIHKSIINAELLILTLGTAWAYKLKEKDLVVANCHKQPSSLFEKELLPPQFIIESFEGLYKELRELNPRLKILLTVSPVRHIKDTLELNSVSKSILRWVCHELQCFKDVFYFPSYEILVDDLRDYRFYKKDLIHPNEIAEDYIWENWCRSFFDNRTLAFLVEWDNISKALNHKPFNVHSGHHQQFVKQQLNKLESFVDIDVQKEKMFFISQLN